MLSTPVRGAVAGTALYFENIHVQIISCKNIQNGALCFYHTGLLHLPHCGLCSSELSPEERNCQMEDAGMCCSRSCGFVSLI